MHKDLYIDIPTVDEFLYTEGIENRDDSYCECVNYREIETFKGNKHALQTFAKILKCFLAFLSSKVTKALISIDFRILIIHSFDTFYKTRSF